MPEFPWWILSVVWLAGSAAIWGTVLLFALRFRAGRPKAASLVLIALGIEGFQWIVALGETVVSAFWTDAFTFSGDQLDWTNSYLVYNVLMQLVHALGDIAVWSLLAWAALMQPDERRRPPPLA